MKTKNKYGNRKTTVYGITFDSKRESQRYLVLRDMQKRGEISDLRLQIPYEIIPSVTICGKKQRAIKYIADFVYTKNGECVVEDSKGYRTREYGIKRRLMKLVHEIEIVEV